MSANGTPEGDGDASAEWCLEQDAIADPLAVLDAARRWQARAERAEGRLAELHRALGALCHCPTAHEDETAVEPEGPHRACPLHGDGKTFVAHVVQLRVLATTAHNYRYAVESGYDAADVSAARERLFDAHEAYRKVAQRPTLDALRAALSAKAGA